MFCSLRILKDLRYFPFVAMKESLKPPSHRESRGTKTWRLDVFTLYYAKTENFGGLNTPWNNDTLIFCLCGSLPNHHSDRLLVSPWIQRTPDGESVEPGIREHQCEVPNTYWVNYYKIKIFILMFLFVEYNFVSIGFIIFLLKYTMGIYTK